MTRKEQPSPSRTNTRRYPSKSKIRTARSNKTSAKSSAFKVENPAEGPAKPRVKQRKLVRLFQMLEPELKELDFDAQELACQMCAYYNNDVEPSGRFLYMKINHREARKQFRHLKRYIDKLLRDLPEIRVRIESLCDPLRDAHIPLYEPISLLRSLGRRGPDLYFEKESLPDPAQILCNLVENLQRTEKNLSEESNWIAKQIPRIQPHWKAKPGTTLRRGNLEYVLMRLIKERSQHKITSIKVQELVATIKMKLGNGTLAQDKIKGGYPAIRHAIKRIPQSTKDKWDQLLFDRIGLPLPC